MTHELKQIMLGYKAGMRLGQKTVLATVVALNGSSYRRPGVRMLIFEDDRMIGAVSGGCVEKEILRQSVSVFNGGIPKVMTYDGRFRLGCEGILYVLIEPFSPDNIMLTAFEATIKSREIFQIDSYHSRDDEKNSNFGSELILANKKFLLHPKAQLDYSLEKFHQVLEPCFKLVIVGAEHDAVQLSSFASKMGWEVSVIAHPTEDKKLTDFPGANELQGVIAKDFNTAQIDTQTAVILMTHSYVKDLQFLIALQHVHMCYLGLLGPHKRREKLLNEFTEQCSEINDAFFDHVYGPAGLNIGAETPQEIAIAILSEILSVIRNTEPIRLRDKEGGIHS